MKKIILAAMLGLLSNGQVFASSLSDFELNGFLTLTGTWTNVDYLPSGVIPTYLTYIQRRPSFDRDNSAGIQITKSLSEEVSITTQLLAQGINEWDVDVAWAFLKWEPNDHWQLRAGRVRTAPFMLSDYLNVGYGYPWVRPPVEVYSQIPEEYSNQTGFDIQFKTPLGKYDFLMKAFYGASTTSLEFPAGFNTTIFDDIILRQRDIFCFNAKFGDEIFSVRIGYERAKATLFPNAGSVMEGLNTFLNALAPDIYFGPFFVMPGIGLDYVNYFSADHITFSFMEIGYQFDWKNIVSMGELVKRHAATPIIANAIGWYLMGGYRVKQFLPHITFGRERIQDSKTRRFSSFINQAFMVPAPDGPGSPIPLDTIAQALIYTSQYYNGGAGSQTSVTLGLRWDVMVGVALKAEYQHVHPDFLTPGLFDVDPGKSVNVYSLAVDAVM